MNFNFNTDTYNSNKENVDIINFKTSTNRLRNHVSSIESSREKSLNDSSKGDASIFSMKNSTNYHSKFHKSYHTLKNMPLKVPNINEFSQKSLQRIKSRIQSRESAALKSTSFERPWLSRRSIDAKKKKLKSINIFKQSFDKSRESSQYNDQKARSQIVEFHLICRNKVKMFPKLKSNISKKKLQQLKISKNCNMPRVFRDPINFKSERRSTWGKSERKQKQQIKRLRKGFEKYKSQNSRSQKVHTSESTRPRPHKPKTMPKLADLTHLHPLKKSITRLPSKKSAKRPNSRSSTENQNTLNTQSIPKLKRRKSKSKPKPPIKRKNTKKSTSKEKFTPKVTRGLIRA
ncbi:unnamed protein product [Moneuplotes crassus]|uniref:Uncharacterized protein n=1 Tax=Euplotes crassus TaxID=5936 RepID=A0AAD2D9V3_EUPCR|nr:unnamed protein product [Moneuplotes crassus]